MQHLVFKITSGLAITALSTSLALAAGHKFKITIRCADIKYSGVDKVVNHGTYLEGVGVEKIDNIETPTKPVFENNIVPGSDIPSDLIAAGYHNFGIEYNSTTGGIICKYKTWKGHDSFTLSSVINNTVGGVTTHANNEEIHIELLKIQ